MPHEPPKLPPKPVPGSKTSTFPHLKAELRGMELLINSAKRANASGSSGRTSVKVERQASTASDSPPTPSSSSTRRSEDSRTTSPRPTLSDLPKSRSSHSSSSSSTTVKHSPKAKAARRSSPPKTISAHNATPPALPDHKSTLAKHKAENAEIEARIAAKKAALALAASEAMTAAPEQPSPSPSPPPSPPSSPPSETPTRPSYSQTAKIKPKPKPSEPRRSARDVPRPRLVESSSSEVEISSDSDSYSDLEKEKEVVIVSDSETESVKVRRAEVRRGKRKVIELEISSDEEDDTAVALKRNVIEISDDDDEEEDGESDVVIEMEVDTIVVESDSDSDSNPNRPSKQSLSSAAKFLSRDARGRSPTPPAPIPPPSNPLKRPRSPSSSPHRRINRTRVPPSAPFGVPSTARSSLLPPDVLSLLPRFGVSYLRPEQAEATLAILSNKDVFLNLPTGAGKSLVGQLAPLWAFEKGLGASVWIVPSVALRDDHVREMEKRGVPVCALPEGPIVGETRERLDPRNLKVALIFLTPEKLLRDEQVMWFLKKLYEAGLLYTWVLDEAHNLSDAHANWRPNYLQLGLIRKDFPKAPIISLSATASPQARTKITTVLGLRSDTVVVVPDSFVRHNIQYSVVRKKSERRGTEFIVEQLTSDRYRDKSAIVYCLTRQRCEGLFEELGNAGVSVGLYYSDCGEKTQYHREWTAGTIKVMVATSAFGEGINLPGVRLMIHDGIPLSLARYYQETGRAGRDGEPADAILLFSTEDVVTATSLIEKQHLGTSSSHLAPSSAVHLDKDRGEFRRVLQYALNHEQCRRAMLHSDEDVDALGDCACDNCRKVTIKNKIDVTDLASAALNLVRASVDQSRVEEGAGRSRQRLTIPQAVLVLTGSSDAKVLGWMRKLAGYGAGKAYTQGDARLVLHHLLAGNFLQLEIRKFSHQKGTTTVGYVKLAPAGEILLVASPSRTQEEFQLAVAISRPPREVEETSSSTPHPSDEKRDKIQLEFVVRLEALAKRASTKVPKEVLTLLVARRPTSMHDVADFANEKLILVPNAKEFASWFYGQGVHVVMEELAGELAALSSV